MITAFWLLLPARIFVWRLLKVFDPYYNPPPVKRMSDPENNMYRFLFDIPGCGNKKLDTASAQKIPQSAPHTIPGLQKDAPIPT
jgi:hypothetical protein